jgi:hypothetical protein
MRDELNVLANDRFGVTFDRREQGGEWDFAGTADAFERGQCRFLRDATRIRTPELFSKIARPIGANCNRPGSGRI